MSQNPPPLTRKLLVLLYRIGLVFCVDLSQALKVPFSVKDVLPVLPRQVSWLVFNSFHNAVNLLLVLSGLLFQVKPLLNGKVVAFMATRLALRSLVAIATTLASAVAFSISRHPRRIV